VKYSEEGIALTEASEGCRLKAYQDTGGVWTIGYGHTGGVRPNQVIDKATADTLFRHDILYAEGIVNQHCLPCTQGQFDALVDFVFNLGPSQFLSSHLFSYHKLREYDKAADEFPKWKYDNGKVEPGLVERRAKERALYSRQGPVVVHPNTDVQEHSVPSVVYSAPASLDQGVVQSLPVQPLPTVSIAPVSSTGLAGFLSQASVLFHNLLQGKDTKGR
jgi:lysozyme